MDLLQNAYSDVSSVQYMITSIIPISLLMTTRASVFHSMAGALLRRCSCAGNCVMMLVEQGKDNTTTSS